MNTAKATVIRIGDDQSSVTVRVDAPVGCARCAAGRGCGAGLTGSTAEPLELDLPVTFDPAGLSVGDSLTLNLPSGSLLQAALLAYGLPLAAAAVAAAFAYLLGATEPVSVLAALGGLAVGMLASAYRSRRLACLESWSPRVEIDAAGSDA